ncbi:hypothetical protein QYM36_013897 [Artemia franciscana]|uniref:Uncharacterized protein n=1 Tax=Artemia franciscana TaxID=6661 RepID=A0AA88KV11_ARTSF|nr:hypothetical protein QYM36_013897 [Artemia franciscana]
MKLAGKPPCMKQEIEAVRRVKSKTALCYSLGGLYSREHRCLVKGKTCTKCHKPNHFAKVCRSKNLHEVETGEDEEGEEFRIEAIDSLSAEAPEKPFVAIRLTQYKTDIKFKIDTGAEGDGSLRICLDPVDLNLWIKRPHHPVPLFEDIGAKCEGARKFFKVDARSGYWSMVLDDESSDLTTFNTVFGRYCWKRYPFGLVSAQDEYQKKTEEAFEGIDIGLIIDNIAGMGATDEEHDRKLAEVLLRAKEKGVKFNRDKCIFDATSIPYFGHILTEEGVKPDPNKTRAIRDMPAPKSKEELHTLLGMYNYLSRYMCNLSTSNQPLRDLMKAKVWKRDGIHEAARKTIQDSICKNLAYFSQHAKLTEVVTDASQHGVGAQLVTDGATVAFASRSLSETERRYSQMEKELLAKMFACKHFHQYLFGRKVYVTTDHKPLEATLSKAINHAPPRLQRMMLAIQPYDLTFHYRPGKEIPVADTLSRLHLPDVDKEAESEGELAIHTFFKQIPITEKRMEHIRQESLQDEELSILIRKAQLKQKTAYDRGSRTAKELNPNQKVCLQLSEDSKWEKATIEKKYDKAPLSYNLSLESGGTFRRNRRDIRPRYEFVSPTTYDGQQIGTADTIPPMGQSLRASTPDKQTSTKFAAEGDKSSAPLQAQAHTRSTPTTRVVLPNPLPTLTGDSSLYSQPGSRPVTITNQQVEQDTTATGGSTQPLASTSQTRTTTSGRVVKPVIRLNLSIDRPNQYGKRLKSKRK